MVKEGLQTYLQGTLDAESEALVTTLCDDCARRAQALIGNRELTDSEFALLASWAASEALYQFLLVQEALSPEKLTADGFSVTISGAAQARALADEKYRALSPILGEGAFYFGGI